MLCTISKNLHLKMNDTVHSEMSKSSIIQIKRSTQFGNKTVSERKTNLQNLLHNHII